MSNRISVSSLLNGQKVVPVAVLENREQALGLSRALIDGGINVIEVTLRSEFAVEALKLIKDEFPEMVVLAGTVNSVEEVAEVAEAGVDGVISPGISKTILEATRKHELPYLPGVATPSEVMLAIEYGLTECKLFPATVVGGISALKAFGGPFADIKFCPTGGVSADNYQDFLALDNVMCVGGSWVASTKLVRAEKWSQITELCKALA